MSFLPRLGRKPWIIHIVEALAIFAAAVVVFALGMEIIALAIFAAAGLVLALGMGIIPNFIPPA